MMKMNLLNNLHKLARSFLFCYVVSALIIICVGYISNNETRRQQLELASIWNKEHPVDSENEVFIRNLIKKIQFRMDEITKKIKKPLPASTIEEKIMDFYKQSEYPRLFGIGKVRKYVNVKKPEPVYSEERGRGELKLQDDEKEIFAHLIKELEGQLYKRYLKEIDSSIDNSDGQDNFRQYSEAVIRYFTSDDSNHPKKIPYLKAYSIYLANKNGAVAFYPSQGIQIRINDFLKRPWASAAWEEDSNKQYPSDYKTDYKDPETGLTYPYIDINDKEKTNIIRTLWYKFKDHNTNTDYVLCLDLFFDSSIYPETNLLAQYASAGLVIQPTKDTRLDFLIQSLIGALLLFFLYEFKLRRIFSGFFASNHDEFLKVKLQINNKHYAAIDEDNEIKFTVQGETKEVNESTTSREAGWSLNRLNVNINGRITQDNIRQNSLSYRYEFSHQYNLNISQTKYRCIETWEVVLESQSGEIENLGFFVAKWNRTNSANILDELQLKSIYLDRNYEDSLETIKAQLRYHLLISEESEFVVALDPNYERRQNIPEYPECLRQIDMIQETLDRSLYLKQRKIVFPEIETINSLYCLGKVKAICSRDFLRILIERKKLREFFKVSVDERYFVENQEADFKEFYESLDDNSKSVLKKTSDLKIMVYQRNINNIISSQDDFCIVEINNKPSMVVYTFTDDKYKNAGWISWRSVDVRFYTELYKSQMNKGHTIRAVDSYLRDYSL